MSVYTDRQLALIAGFLSKQEILFSFGYDLLYPQFGKAVFYAEAAFANYSPFSSVVTLLQTMVGKGFKSTMQIHVSDQSQKAGFMADGMMRFLDCQWPNTPVVAAAFPS